MTSSSTPEHRDQGTKPPSQSLIKADKSNKLAGAKEALKQKLLKAVMSQAIQELGSPDDIATTVLEHIGEAEHQLLVDAQTALRKQVVQRIADQTLQSLENSAETASEALSYVAPDDASIEQAEADLKAILVKQIAQRSVERIKDAESVEAARNEVDEQHSNVLAAIESVRDSLVATIANRATGQLSDVDAVVEEAQEHIDFEADDLSEAIGALRDVILVTIADRATHMLADSETVAQEAREQVNNDHELIIAASGVLRELVLEDIAARTSDGMQDVGTLARQAKSRIDHENKTLIDAIEQLREMLLEEVANRSVSTLADTGESAKRARTALGDKPEAVEEATSRLEDMLIDEIAQRSAATIKDAANVASLAMDRINVDAPEIEEAQQIVHERMLSAIMDDAIDEINDAMADGPEAAVSFLEDAPPVSRKQATQIPASFGEAETSEPKARTADDALPPPPRLGFSFVSAAEAPAHEAHDFGPEGTEDGDTPTDLPPSNDNPEADAEPVSEVEEELVDEVLDVQEADTSSIAYEGDGAFSDATSAEVEAPASVFAEEEPTSGFFASDDEGDFFDESTEPSAYTPPSATTAPIFEGQAEDEGEESTDEDRSWMALGEASDQETAEVEVAPEASAEEADAWNFTAFEPMQFDDEDEEDSDDHSDATSDSTTFATPPAFNPNVPVVQSKEIYYIYGIVATASLAGLADDGYEGIDPEFEVEYLSRGDLSAIVSKVSSSVYGPSALNENLKNGLWVRENVRAHAQILEQFRAQSTLVPLRFGTVYGDASEVMEMLEANADAYLELLANLRGKQEWGLRIYRDLEALTSHLSETDEHVHESLTAISKGVARFVKEEMNALAAGDEQENADLLTAHCAKRSHDLLSAFAENAVFKALVPGNNDGKGEMIANVAYLVAEEHEQALHKAIGGLRKQYETLGFSFEMTGPWPPYHFVESEDANAS